MKSWGFGRVVVGKWVWVRRDHSFAVEAVAKVRR